jgi:bifunctional non-homologous end joining protein LigD
MRYPRVVVASAKKATAAPPSTRVGAVRLTNPQKLLYPETGITKRGLAEYYERVAPWMLPHVARRPLTLVRCPSGWASGGFFQKHAKGGLPAGVRVVKYTTDDVLSLEDAKALVACAQMCVLELHTWAAHVDTPDAPEWLVFDLDPDPAVAWSFVVETAHLVRERLRALGHESFVKTTGGKGLHVCIAAPVGMTWSQAHAFGQELGESMAAQCPERYLTSVAKAKRKGKILLDFARNGRGSTFVAPYSPRARAGAPVATPVRWEELTPDLRPDTFTILDVCDRLAANGDPWAALGA